MLVTFCSDDMKKNPTFYHIFLIFIVLLAIFSNNRSNFFIKKKCIIYVQNTRYLYQHLKYAANVFIFYSEMNHIFSKQYLINHESFSLCLFYLFFLKRKWLTFFMVATWKFNMIKSCVMYPRL